MYNSGVAVYLQVRQCFFRSIFVRKYNIGFGSPKVDVCSKCLQFSEKIKQASTLEEKATIITEQRLHKLRAKAFYKLLQEDDPKVLILSFDCQKNLPLPKIPDQACYFSMQINLYNFTVVIGNSKTMLTPETVKSFLWSEVDRRKSSNEIASAVFHTLSNHVFQDDVEIVRLMADGCAGQNKNCTVIGMMCYWLHFCAPTCIKRIEIVFPIVGHSFLPPDRVFGHIEKKLRKTSTIVDPQKYFDIIKEFSSVLKMGKDYVVCDWKAESANVLKTPASWHFKLQKSKRIIISKTANGSVEVKGEPYYNSDVSVFSGICKRGKKIAQMKPKQLDVGRPVKPDKIKSISSLLTLHYDLNWQENPQLSFFKNAFQQGNVEDVNREREAAAVLTDSENEDVY